eukprot:m.138163 g.138163  ORF g.138163 m.138163 type:complete len:120 (-) comp29973_c2_seq4:1264-1623(-)
MYSGSCSASVASSNTSNGTSTSSINPHKLDNIVALCHFCENHGPRIIMCTQSTPLGNQGGCVATLSSMRTSTSNLIATNVLSEKSSVPVPSQTYLNTSLPNTSSTKKDPLCQGCGWTSK